MIGIIFRFPERQIAFSADIEAMFLQNDVSSDDSRCLQYFWWEDQEHKMQLYAYTRHKVWAKTSQICANYALQKWRKVMHCEGLVKRIQQIYYMDNFLKSVRTPEEEIEI